MWNLSPYQSQNGAGVGMPEGTPTQDDSAGHNLSCASVCAYRECSKKDDRNPGKTGKAQRLQEKPQIFKNS